MEPLHSNPTSYSTSSGKMGGKQPRKFNFLKRIWNGLTDLLASKGLTQRNIKHLTRKEGVTGAVDRVSQKVFPKSKSEKAAKNHAKKAIQQLVKLAKKNPEAPWVKHMPAIKETIRIAADLSQKKSTVEQGNQTELTVQVGKTDLVLHAIDTGETLEIVGLFGKPLGEGGLGKTTHLVNFLTGNLSSEGQGQTGVIKDYKTDTGQQKETFKHELKINQVLSERLKTIPVEKQRYFAPGHLVKDPVSEVDRLMMPLASGVELGDYIENNEVSEEEKIEITKQVLAAVDTLHEMGIYHNDLHLGNFMISKNEGKIQVKLIDFGGSQAFQLDTQGKPINRLVEGSKQLQVGWFFSAKHDLAQKHSTAFYHYQTQPTDEKGAALKEVFAENDKRAIAIELVGFLSDLQVETTQLKQYFETNAPVKEINQQHDFLEKNYKVSTDYDTIIQLYNDAYNKT